MRARKFASQLADTLYDLGITHKALALELGVSLHTIDSWTRAVDPSLPGPPNLDRLCDLLERKQPGAGLALARASGHTWEPPSDTDSTAPTPEPVQLHAVAAPTPTNLPNELSSFIGREQQLAQVAQLLKEARLLTLTGPGGTGKTRLSLQVAAQMLDKFPDGVWFVELAAITDYKLVVSAIASTLGVKEAAGQPLIDTLRAYLHNKQMLVIADNFEQVMPAAAQVVQLVTGCPHLKVLATSRAPLRVRGVHEYPVPPLSVPDAQDLPAPEQLAQYEAVRLFIERASEIKPDFEVNEDNAAAVAEICVRLDGLPLAIELAAARTRLFSPQALLGRLSSRLKVLVGGASDLPARHQTLRNTVDWSYDLLSEVDKQLFRRMAVFQGGCTLEAIEALCPIDVLEGVESLVSKNLLQQREGSGGEPRLWMLETIHEYAREKLQESGEGEALRREHARYFMGLAEEAEPQLMGAQQGEWLSRLEYEHVNIREALRWAKEMRGRGQSGEEERSEAAEIGLRTAGALWRFWYVRGYLSEAREQFAGVLSEKPAGRDMRAISAKALNGAANLAWQQGDYASARTLYEESLAIRRELGSKKGIAGSLAGLGIVAHLQGDYSRSRTLQEESLAINRELGDRVGIASALNNLGNAVYSLEDYVSARPLYVEAVAIFRELGDKFGIANSLSNVGIVAHAHGDYASARSLHEESLAIRRGLGDKVGCAYALHNLANAVHRQGDAIGAGQLYTESLNIRREIGAWESITISIAGLGAVACSAGQPIKGARLLGAVEAMLESLGSALAPDDRAEYEQGAAAARAQLDEEAFAAAWAEGRAMSMEQAIEYALDETH